MTNEELQQHINAINNACGRGELQHRSTYQSDDWTTRTCLMLSPDLYRIKPKPREVYILRAALSGEEHATTAWKVSPHSEKMFDSDYAKFREVIE